MRLILREYLALQKESGEIDKIVPDLLLAMGIRPLNRPGTGVRQFGVDIPAVGVDPEDGVQKLFLLTAKQGDIIRSGWDTGPDAVRQSLNDILSSYLRHKVEPEHQGFPVKVVLVTGGEIQQAVYPDWVDYTNNNAGTVNRGGVDYTVSFAFWGGDTLADLIQRYLVNEYLFPEEAQSVMRRTLALLGEPAFDLGPFEKLIDDTLDPTKLGDRDKRLRALRFLRLAVRVIYRWGEREGNLRPALLAAEYAVIRVWGFLSAAGLAKPRRREMREWAGFYESWRDVMQAYYNVLQPHAETENGLFGFSAAERVEYAVRVYDLLGHLAAAGLDEVYLAAQAMGLAADAQSAGEEGGTETIDVQAAGENDAAGTGVSHEPSTGGTSPPVVNPNDLAGLTLGDVPPAVLAAAHLQNVEAIANRVAAVITNNPAASAPPFDENAIEVALVLTLFTAAGRENDAAAWVIELARRMAFAKNHVDYGFPLYVTSHEDLTDLALGLAEPEMPASTILPLLAEWALILNRPDVYEAVRAVATEQLPEVNLQTWYPTDDTEPALYRGPAIDTGLVKVSTKLTPTMEGFRAQVQKEATLESGVAPYSADAMFPTITVLANRRFRTPIRPSFWRRLIAEDGGVSDEARPAEHTSLGTNSPTHAAGTNSSPEANTPAPPA